MTWFINSLDEIENVTNVFTTIDIMIVLILSTILCLIVAKTYKETHEGLSYSQDFSQTLIIFGILVANIMLIIGSNIARAFTLVGALSIVRFRNAIKQTRDIGFIFFVMTVGMAVGTRFFTLAVILTLFVCTLIILMKRYNIGSKKENDEILKMLIPKNTTLKDLNLESTFTKYLKKHQLLSIDLTENNKLNEAVVLISFKKGINKDKLLEEINSKTEIKNAYIIETDYLIY